MFTFNFSYTCPLINENIEKFRNKINKHIKIIIKNFNPILSNSELNELAKKYECNIYNDIEKYFENIRSSNKDIRTEAENQIEQIKIKLNNKDNELAELISNIYNLEKEIDNLKSELLDKNNKLKNLNIIAKLKK